MMADKFGPPTILSKDDHLEVKLPMYFRDEGWANGMGQVQDEITRWAEQISVNSKKVVFDFSSCRWIDPFPLMSLLIEIAQARHLGLPVEILLPEPDDGPKPTETGPYQVSPNRLLWFLHQEGFLDCLDRLMDCLPSLHEGREIHKKLNVTPSYEDARCVPIHLFDVPTTTEDKEFVMREMESIMSGVDSTLAAKIAPNARERLIYKLRVILQELLHNAQEHAYEDNASSRRIAIYVRYRSGGFGLGSSRRPEYEQCVKEEGKHCPTLNRYADWLNTRSGCLEVFVLDRGIGIVRSFEKAGVSFEERYKFREVLQKTFFKGHSTKSERQTLYGGLHLLHSLLEQTSDFIRALEGGVWFASGVPIDRPTAQIHQLVENQARIHGLAMHFRLGWKEETDFGDKWARFEQGFQSEIWHELSLSENECESAFNWFKDRKVFDERFGALTEYGSRSDWILWLVRPHRMKWDILNFMESTIAPKSAGNTTLIIADIPSYEAETYAAALSEFKALGTIDWPVKFPQIILTTNRWRFSAVNYKKYGRRHGFSKCCEDFTTFKATPPLIDPKPQSFRLAVVRWLKWHDSRKFWDEVNNRRSMFIPERIAWGQDDSGQSRIIEGYLDFPQTTHNRLCADIYRTSLARILSVLPPQKYKLHSLDRLTIPILREVHIEEVYEPTMNEPEKGYALGSILVSGSTLKASVSPHPDLHFFVHYSSPLRGEKPSLLFWLPVSPVSNEPPKLTRIGKTATVAPEGWKSFEVPRYDEQGNCVGKRIPEETYQDWQSTYPIIAKSGHWTYEGQHDFLTINIASAVEAAFLEKNDLARYLVCRILPFIGLDKNQVDTNWHRLMEGQGNNSIRKFSFFNHGILIYRSHPSSESVIRMLLNILTPEGRKQALLRIFSVLPIRMRWSGSTLLIPPLVREDIRKALRNDNQTRAVLLFDDAAITGRTLQDLRCALSAIGATEIHSMVIVNRLRQPSEGSDCEHLNYYWRLDLPVMGREGNCPLCHALHLTKTLSSSLVTTNAKNEIKKWLHQWSDISPDNWSAGLRPLPLAEIKRKKYCYRQSSKEYMSEIDLSRSTGLTIHVSELHAMTGRDDYCLKKIDEHKEPEIRVELAASQILLFGNEFDQDVRIELVKTLIRELARLKQDSPHAPLAALTALWGLGLLEKGAREQTVKIVHESGWTVKNNYATKILLAYLVSERLIEPGTVAYEKGVRLLATASLTLAQRLNAWFLETLSRRGNAHSEAIPVLIDELTEATEIKDEQIKDALDSLDHLADNINGLGRDWVRKGALDRYGIKIDEMKQVADAAKELLQQYLSSNTPNIDASWRANTKCTLEKYLIAMKYVVEAYFHLIPDAKEYHKERTFETVALRRITDNRIDWKQASDGKTCNGNSVEKHERTIRFSNTGKIYFDSGAGEIWITWHRRIAGIVLDLLRNAVYAHSKISDPWDSGRNECADLWVRVDYKKEYLALTLVNASPCNSNEVFTMLKKDRWSYLKELGGLVEPAEVSQEGLAGISVIIPYAGYLRS